VLLNLYRGSLSKLLHIQGSLRTKDSKTSLSLNVLTPFISNISMVFSDICKVMKEELIRANQRIEHLVGREEDFQEILRFVP
jgi:hypothetical protein